MTAEDIVNYVLENSSNGILDISVIKKESIQTDGIGPEPIFEEHEIRYFRISLHKEDVTLCVNSAIAMAKLYNKEAEVISELSK